MWWRSKNIVLEYVQIKVCYIWRFLYVNPIVTTKQKAIVNTENIMRKVSKHNTKESHQTTREDSKRWRKEWRLTKKPGNNDQNGNKYTPVSNYFKGKWNKLSNPKTLIAKCI